MPDPKEIIGEAGVKALADAGFTITPPKAPEPVRLVTMEESAEAFVRRGGNGDVFWGAKKSWVDYRFAVNAADNWLVRTVNRRIIEGLPYVGVGAHRTCLFRIFCGEGNP